MGIAWGKVVRSYASDSIIGYDDLEYRYNNGFDHNSSHFFNPKQIFQYIKSSDICFLLKKLCRECLNHS